MRSQNRILIAFVILALAMTSACTRSTSPDQTPTPDAPLTSEAPANTPPPVDTPVADIVTFIDQNNLLSFTPPVGWLHQNETQPREYYKDAFTSPDGNAKIESLVYNDGTPFDPLENGKFALYLLNTYYSSTGKAGDIRITSGEGTQRLEWISDVGGYSGISSFELRGDNLNFVMFTAKWANGTDQAMLDTINAAIASYGIP